MDTSAASSSISSLPNISTGSNNNSLEEPMDVSDVEAVKKEDDDDDVVIMKEEKLEQSVKRQTLKNISRTIDDAKDIVKLTDAEITILTEELQALKDSLTESVLQSLHFLIENPNCMLSLPVDIKGVERMIDAVLASLPIGEMLDLTKEEFETYDDKLHFIERANQSVSKLFLDCHSRLKEFKQSLISETEDVDTEIKEYEGKSTAPTCVLIDSDDDDDVTILTPPNGSNQSEKGKERKSPGRSVGPSPSKASQSPSAPRILAQSGKIQSMPSLEQLRSQFTTAVNKSMPTVITSQQTQQSPDAAQVQRPIAPQPVRWPELKVQDKVLGKKFNDVWYYGTILDIYPAAPEENQEWRCKVKFDGKGMKTLPGRQVAYKDPINCFLRVGTRIVALYREDDAPSTFYAGVIAEAPSIKNNRRFLVFFDDGYAQYCEAKELHKVYMQSENVWEDINIETSAFIKEYLRIYPERPMVRLSKGQVVRTEWNGKWWTAKVVETDASLVKMYFQADKRVEWIYRGSTRLEPLFKALANADAIKAAGSARGRRHNLTMRPSDALKPSVEYTRGVGEEDNGSSSTTAKSKYATKASESSKKKSNVAKKSTGGGSGSEGSKTGQWEAPWIRYQRKAAPGTQRSRSTDLGTQDSDRASSKDKSQPGQPSDSRPAKDIASILQERLASAEVEYDEESATGERKEVRLEPSEVPRKPFKPHKCGPACLYEINDGSDKFKGRSSLTIPLLYGWERQVCKTRPSTKRHIIYRAPCGRRLRSIEEVDQYLLITNSNLTIDLFCFDQQLHVNIEFVPVKTFCDIKDLSYGKENYPISCVNGIDRLYPDYVEYSDHRIPSTGVKLNLDPNFLVCCDCTDNCRDKSKCACQQMTIQNTSWIGEIDPDAGYHYKRLPEPLFTGIVECNMRCKCDKRCHNRVAQQGLQMRLQVFKTEKKGWGLRCLDDIAKGSFICIYAGQLLTDRGANEDGKQYGDEYLAELDFIEVVERQKEGYESDVDIEFSDDENDVNYKASKDSAEDDSDYTSKSGPPEASRRKLRGRRRNDQTTTADTNDNEQGVKKKPDVAPDTAPSVVSEAISISDEDDEEEEAGEAPPTEIKQPSKDKLKARAKKSTGGSRFNLSTTFKTSHEPVAEMDASNETKERAPTRSFFNDDTECYIMDAKSMGNLGRYLNHSCTPNVFVQNIFVDTHDLRFPWVAFFSGQYIRAGTELTWDYNYEVGSVPDKVLYCYCGSPMCRGRLL
ncbi:hypothetical protein BsWGS_08044 [Bradybaena similaris]